MTAERTSAAHAGASPSRPVRVIDATQSRVHRFSDLMAMLATVVGIVLVLLLGAYAHGTTEGVAEDVQGISRVLQRLLVAPVNLMSGIVNLIVPAAIIIDLAVRREPRRILEVLGAGLLAFIVSLVSAYAATSWGAPELIQSLTARGTDGDVSVQLPAYLAAVSAMLTAAGLRSGRRVLAISWNVLWIAAAVAFISGIVTLPAVVTVVLIGRASGLALRYLLGSTADRAYDDALVEGIRRTGYEPRRVVRADAVGGYEPEDVDPVTVAVGRTRSGRVYDVLTVEGHHLLAVALDGDQHTAGLLAKLWNTMRLRGIDARAEMSVRHTAESASLVSHAARTAGVRTARVLGMSQVRDTMITVYQHPTATRALCDMAPEDVDDALIDALWAEVGRAHAAGISHRNISAETVLVDDDDGGSGVPAVWLTTWELGEVASSPLSRRIDNAQVLAVAALYVGAERAVDSAFRALGDENVESTAPLLQAIALPRATRHALRAHDKLLQQVRQRIVERLPEAELERENIARFGWRTVLTFIAALVAIGIVLAGFNAQETLAALEQANLWWIVGSLGWGMLTFVGASLAMVAFSPIRLPFLRVLTVQVAAAYLALAVPAGIGPAALNLRMLTRRRVAGPIAVATVALVQVSAIVITVVGLIVLTLITGSRGTLAALPSTTVLIGIGAAAAVLVAALLVPQVRRWALAKAMPTLRQTGPRLVQILGNPTRLALGLAGNLLQSIAFVGAFYSALQAFGQDLAIIDVTILFFLSNAVGALVPTPGGLIAVEAALIAGLVGAGVPLAVAGPVVIIYRLITYWARIPVGYAAFSYLQRKGEL